MRSYYQHEICLEKGLTVIDLCVIYEVYTGFLQTFLRNTCLYEIMFSDYTLTKTGHGKHFGRRDVRHWCISRNKPYGVRKVHNWEEPTLV